MKTHDIVTTGNRTHSSWYLPGPVTSQYVYTDSFVRRRRLWNLTSVVGDHKKPNPHAYEVFDVKYLKGGLTYKLYDNSSGGGISGNLISYTSSPDTYFPLEAFPSNVYNNALSKCYDKLRGTIDLSVDIAQLGQTAGMIRAIGKVETYTSSFRSLKALVKGVAAARLVYVYGIKPTVSTIYDCIDKVQQALNDDLLVIRERAQDSVSVVKYVSLPDFMQSVYQSPHHVVTLGNNAHKCEIKLRFKPLNDSLGTWTSLNPASIAWELLPYSFVVDWFLDIGNYVRSLETALLYRNQFVDGYVTRLSHADYSMKNRYSKYTVGSGPGLNNCEYTAESTGKRIRFQRSVLTTAPTPELPSFKADLGSARLLNAAALLAVLLKTDKRGR